MNYTALDSLCKELGIKYKENEPMSSHTGFKIGGVADRFVLVPSVDFLKKIIACAKKTDVNIFILGNGSNLLVRDKGIRGAVLVLVDEFKEIKLLSDTEIFCGAGAMLSSLCVFAKNNCLTGLEFAYGIPGTAGGAAYMNAGAYGGEMKDVLTQCNHLDFNGNENTFKDSELKLSYRHSVYCDDEYIITGLILSLKKADISDISSKMEELMSKRKDKQPLNYPSAGSTFKRPEGYFAAALIDECGLKGVSVGDAEVSKKHSGFVINKGNATCKDVLDLIDIVKEKVQNKKGVALECEVKLVGEK